jgi:signal transduction histidine kinase
VRRSSNGNNAMATRSDEHASLIDALQAEDWPTVLRGVGEADRWLRMAAPGVPQASATIEALVRLAGHKKWEVRRAVANVAARTVHPSFEPVLARFVADDNALVREAARRAALRRRDWQNASAFGRQHEQHINATLDDIENRFGVRGREAVRRASEQIADTFARELYHEMIKLLAPIANSAERLRGRLSGPGVLRSQLAEDATTIGRRVTHLKAVLDAMRAYTAPPTLAFAVEDVTDIVAEALAMVREGGAQTLVPASVLCGGGAAAEVCRPRIVQALTNLLVNAIESYDGIADPRPICVTSQQVEGRVEIIVEDFGCGMSGEVLADATVLFTTSKPHGTGFGLPLAMKIVEAEHGGRLTIESEKGRGTIVRVALPTLRPRDS